MKNSPPTGSRSLLGIDGRFARRSLVIGVLPLLALLVLFGGDAALQLIIVSTICTFGIGGFFWVGVAMLFGAVLQLLVPALRARPPAEAAPAARHPGLDPLLPGGKTSVSQLLVNNAGAKFHRLLVNYACAKLRQGASEEGLRRDLLWTGWTEIEVTAVLEEARALVTAPPVASSGRAGDAG